MEEHLKSSYLYAIQEIKGITIEEKKREIHRIVKSIKNESHFTTVVEENRVPTTLVPLIKVLFGLKIKSNPYIIEALRSGDSYLIKEALKARWFYYINNTPITNYKYYSTEILPYVSAYTRRKIAKALAFALSNNHIAIAEDFFNGFAANYGAEEAVHFLPSCGSEFIAAAIVKHKIMLSNKLLKTIYRVYPETATNYLQFLLPEEPAHAINELNTLMYIKIPFNSYYNFLPLLIRNYPEILIKLYQQYPIPKDAPRIGKKSTTLFIKNSKELFIKKSRGILGRLHIKTVDNLLTTEEFETVFGNSLSDQFDEFKVDDALECLEYYPKEKRAALLINKVKEMYGRNLLDEVGKITTNFIEVLPDEERYALARKMIQVEKDRRRKANPKDSERFWWTYLPLEEAICALKLQLGKTVRLDRREQLFEQLLYTCKFNNKCQEKLPELLKYVDENQRNETPEVLFTLIIGALEELDFEKFDQSNWKNMFNIIERFLTMIKIKKPWSNKTKEAYLAIHKILKLNAKSFVNRSLPIFAKILNLISEIFLVVHTSESWTILEDDVEYERQYLDACLKYDYWKNVKNINSAIDGIYRFNERHKLSDDSPHRLSIKNYPELLRIAEKALHTENSISQSVNNSKEKLKKHEPELYKLWFPCEDEIKSDVPQKAVSSDGSKQEIIGKLSKNFDEVRSDWNRYYQYCKKICWYEVGTAIHRKVKRFLRALRWYQDIPIKFLKRAIEDKNIEMLGYLLDGKTFSNIVPTFLLKKTSDGCDRNDSITRRIAKSIRSTSSPFSIDLVKKYLLRSSVLYLKYYNGMRLWKYVAYRSTPDEAITLTRNLSKHRIYLMIESIRVATDMASRKELVSFFTDLWNGGYKNILLKELLASQIGKLFVERPCEETWKLTKHCIESLSDGQDNLLFAIIKFTNISPEFSSEYAQLVFDKIYKWVKRGCTSRNGTKLFNELFTNLVESQTDVPESLHQQILEYYFKEVDSENRDAFRFITKIYLNPSNKNIDSRIENLLKLLVEASQRWYSKPITERWKRFCIVDSFLDYLVLQEKCNECIKIAQRLGETFLANLQLHQHTRAQIMLLFCVLYIPVKREFKKFGKNVANVFDSFVNKHQSQHYMEIVEYLREFIIYFSFYDDSDIFKNRVLILEGLIESGNENGLIIAAKLLKEKLVRNENSSISNLLTILSESDDPRVLAFL